VTSADNILLLVVLISVLSLMFQAYAILTGKYGYKNAVREKKRAAIVRKQMEEIIHANGRLTEED
tara:strand:- start:166 stop:360 length:195 start_codon:yes stop_codon:yes gene_type:complete